MKVVNEGKLKTVRVKDETHEKIIRCGRMSESMDDVVNRVCDYYIERELSDKSKK